MKKILFTAVLFIGFVSHAQEYLGIWSFESVDREAIDDGVKSEEELEKSINMVSNMFSSFRLNFSEDGTYEMNMMGQVKSYSYTANENILLLEDGGKLEILTDKKARYTLRNMMFFLQKGDLSIEKKYTHLTKEKYENKKLNTKNLIGKWRVEEVRVPNGVEGAETMEMIGIMITLNFITETDMATGVLGVENVQKYKIDSNTNQLILIKDKTGEKTPTYIIHELDEKHMIVSHVKEGMLLYMVKE